MKTYIIVRGMVICMIAIFVISCEKQEGSIITAAVGEFDISSPKVGQQSKFIRYTGDCIANSWELTGDTLIMTVDGTISEMVLRETFTPGSPSFDPTWSFTHKLIDNADHILIPERFDSQLFFFYGNDTIWKNPEHDFNVTLEDCMLFQEDGEPFIGDEIAYSPVLDIQFGELEEVTLISCVPGWLYDVEAFLAYDNHLQASHALLASPFDPSVNGWIRIE